MIPYPASAPSAAPTDDMLSVVANDQDCALTELELYLFFSLLFSAGAETTRNAVAGGLLAAGLDRLRVAVLVTGERGVDQPGDQCIDGDAVRESVVPL